VTVAQLDINWSWTRFLLYGGDNGDPTVTSTLVPQMVHAKQGYVKKPGFRDFFYLLKR
jgi:hypothetical protein